MNFSKPLLQPSTKDNFVAMVNEFFIYYNLDRRLSVSKRDFNLSIDVQKLLFLLQIHKNMF